ncbi:MAG: OB-fold nucleic acid binding domain-containing protein [Thermoplasmata archaeon]
MEGSKDGIDFTHCPKCKRFVGPLEECPFCGADVPKKKSTIYLKYSALAIAVVGTLLLIPWAASLETPLIKVKDIYPGYNNAVIKVKGIVPDTPSFYDNPTGKAFYFSVDDGTGIMPIKVYDDVVRDMLALNSRGKPLIPAFGDRVEISGSLQYRSNDFYMIVNHVNQIKITRGEPAEVTIKEILSYTQENEGTRVMVRGNVTSIREYSFAYDYVIQDFQGYKIDVFVPKSLGNLTGALPEIKEKNEIRVAGALKYYKSGNTWKWEIIPSASWEIEVLA